MHIQTYRICVCVFVYYVLISHRFYKMHKVSHELWNFRVAQKQLLDIPLGLIEKLDYEGVTSEAWRKWTFPGNLVIFVAKKGRFQYGSTKLKGWGSKWSHPGKVIAYSIKIYVYYI